MTILGTAMALFILAFDILCFWRVFVARVPLKRHEYLVIPMLNLLAISQWLGELGRQWAATRMVLSVAVILLGVAVFVEFYRTRSRA